MNPLAVERLCNSVIRRISLLATREISPCNVVVRRLDAHLRKRSQFQRRHLTTSTTVRDLSPLIRDESTRSDTFIPQNVPVAQEQELVDAQQVTYGLPQSCPGCGALTQESEPDQAGYYSSTRRRVLMYLRKQRALARTKSNEGKENPEGEPEEAIVEEEVNDTQDRGQEVIEDTSTAGTSSIVKTPLCDRCHDLVHNSRGLSIAHPTIDSIADSIAESPFKRNHIYHVIDAADFPMSLVPEIFNRLTMARPRSQNRRSQHDFSTKPTMSFIITRSDLLGPTKEIVDEMMTYFQSVLRRALGRAGRDMRLGNIHLVSAKRGWWTKDIQEDIWKRGGGNWMMGKVNVGKSNLFEVLFPKGSGERAPIYGELRQQQDHIKEKPNKNKSPRGEELLSEDSLLPPAQIEDPFPVMPVVSSLPGTTASPIRLPFGSHRGELIDLPGLERGNLEDYVKQEHKLDLVMTHRHNVEQHTIKAGQSLLLGGGLIRITPYLDPDDRETTVLAYPFVPLKAHVTSTAKASAQQSQERQSGIETVLEENVGAHMASAGTFQLATDVTKARSGALLRAGVNMQKLAFRVYATDVLLEGVGWVELVCQVRKRQQRRAQLTSDLMSHEQEPPNNAELPSAEQIAVSGPEFKPFANQPPLEDSTDVADFEFPKIEIFSPNGKHVSQRPCLSAWTRWNGDRRAKNGAQLRKPRRSTQTTRQQKNGSKRH